MPPFTAKDIYNLLRVTGQIAGGSFESDPGVAARVVNDFIAGGKFKSVVNGLEDYRKEGKQLPIAIPQELLNLVAQGEEVFRKSVVPIMSGTSTALGPSAVLPAGFTRTDVGVTTSEATAAAQTQRGATESATRQVTLPNGQQVTVNAQGNIVSGQPQFTSIITGTKTDEDANLESILSASGLSSDEQSAIRSIFNVVSAHDQEMAQQFLGALSEGAKSADVIFKQKLRLVENEVMRGFVSLGNELEFKKQQAERRIQQLQEDKENVRGFLSLEKTQALNDIENKYTQTLETTRQDLAARGFTFSSERERQERVLGESRGELRESTERAFAQKRREQVTTRESDILEQQKEIKRLDQLFGEKGVELFRSAEERLGTSNLPSLPGQTPLGFPITGTLAQERGEQVLSFAKNFIL